MRQCWKFRLFRLAQQWVALTSLTSDLTSPSHQFLVSYTMPTTTRRVAPALHSQWMLIMRDLVFNTAPVTLSFWSTLWQLARSTRCKCMQTVSVLSPLDLWLLTSWRSWVYRTRQVVARIRTSTGMDTGRCLAVLVIPWVWCHIRKSQRSKWLHCITE